MRSKVFFSRVKMAGKARAGCGWRGELTSKGDPILCCSKVYLGERGERLVPRIIMRRRRHPSFASIAKLALSALPAHPRNLWQNRLGVKWNHMARAMTFTTRMTTLKARCIRVTLYVLILFPFLQNVKLLSAFKSKYNF